MVISHASPSLPSLTFTTRVCDMHRLCPRTGLACPPCLWHNAGQDRVKYIFIILRILYGFAWELGQGIKKKGGYIVRKYSFQFDVDRLDCILKFPEEIRDRLSNIQ